MWTSGFGLRPTRHMEFLDPPGVLPIQVCASGWPPSPVDARRLGRARMRSRSAGERTTGPTPARRIRPHNHSRSSVAEPVLIRRALVIERGELETLQRQASLNNPGDREALLAHPDAIEVPLDQLFAGQVLVAEIAGTIRGFATVLPRADGDAELDALFVLPNYWRRGLGRMLIGHSEVIARGNGAAALHVTGNPHAEKFYLACGFEVVGSASTRFGPGLLMRKPL